MYSALETTARVTATCREINRAATLLRRRAEMIETTSIIAPSLCLELPSRLRPAHAPRRIDTGTQRRHNREYQSQRHEMNVHIGCARELPWQDCSLPGNSRQCQRQTDQTTHRADHSGFSKTLHEQMRA